MANIRRQIYYSGRVQGVGFRMTTRSHARRFSVTGFVRNLVDGRVELVAEGESDEIDRFLSSLRTAMTMNIRSEQCVEMPASGEFRDFEIT